MQCLSKLEKSPNILASPLKLFEIGQQKEKSNVPLPQQERECTISITSFQNQNQMKIIESSSTAECLQESKKKTSKGRYQKQKSSSLKQKSLAKLVPDSTGSAKNLENLSVEQLEENFKKLKSFTGIDYADLASKSSNLSLAYTKLNYPSSKETVLKQGNRNLQKISLQSPITSPVQCMEGGSMRAMKLKIIKIEKAQAKTLRMMMGLYRKTYNIAIDELKSNPKLSKFDLRDKFNNCNLPEDDHLLGLMKNIRAEGAFEAKKNFQVATKNKKGDWYRKINQDIRKCYASLRKAKRESTKDKYQKKIDDLVLQKKNPPEEFPFMMNYKTKKSPNQCMNIPKAAISYNSDKKEITIAPSKHKLVLKLKEAPKDFMLNEENKFKHDVKVLISCTGTYLQVPYTYSPEQRFEFKREKELLKLHKKKKKIKDSVLLDELIAFNKESSLQKKKGFIAFDPGIRTFLTGVDHNGNMLEIGENLIEDLKDKIYKRNKAQQKLETGKSISKAILQRKYAKIVNTVRNYHCHISCDLEKYETIFLPKLSTKSICFGKSGKFNDNAHILSHCKFFERMAMNHPGLIEADERFTTKMCCKCFSLNEIGSSKDYCCNNCNFKADRDLNSAVNILVKNFSQVQGL